MSFIKEKLPEIERIIQEELERSKAPGLAVGFVEKGKLIFSKGYGTGDIEKEVPITTDTVFRWGSVSKLFTCMGLFQLWEEGKINLDDPVNGYLKNGKIHKKRSSWPDITFKHLLTHTAGIGEARRFLDIFQPGFRLLTYDNKPVPPMSRFHELPQYAQSPAGQKYAYSNIGGSILGYITELVSGEPFQEYMLNHILKPLGMDRSDFDRSERVNQWLATGYKFKKGQLVPAKPWNNIIKPSGGLHSTIEDMAKFASCLLQKGSYPGGSILKENTLELIWEPHYWSHDSFKGKDCLGYIFRIGELNGKKIVWHTGGLSGFSSTFDLIPSNGIAFFTVANLSEGLHKRITFRLRHWILKILTGLENTFNPNVKPDKSWWPKIKGYYGPYPGWLANTRTILDGVDFKITEKEEHLIFSSLFGEHKKGLVLHPTEDPLVYQYPQEEAENADYVVRVGFTPDENGNKIKEMAINLHQYRKNKPVNTARFKLFSLIMSLIVMVILLVILASLP